MTFNSNLLTLIFIAGILVSCSRQEKEIPNSSDLQKVPSQIGTFFDQKLDPQDSKFDKSIFTIRSEMTGTQGIAIYLGDFYGKKIFLTNRHIINEDTDDCDSQLSLVDVKGRIYLGCSGFIHSFTNIDLTLISMDHVFNTNTDFEFKALSFSFDPILINQNLFLRTIDNDLKALVLDESLDCMALDSNVRMIFDPFPQADETKIRSWSLPVGCDAKPGDSGAPVFALNSSQVVGILWGGKHNKSYTSSEDLVRQVHETSSRIWQDYNFIIPSSVIKSELANEISMLNSQSDKVRVLTKIYNNL